jgi:excinuclease ABC subunit A
MGFLTLSHARTHNLKDLTVKFPLGVLCGISGVSGSGKSTLIMDELVPTLSRAFNHKYRDIVNNKISGYEKLDSLVVIDQTPIGRTPRSNPATYLGIFDDIRKLFASLPESNARGYQPGRFSFNVREGRCDHCSGEGLLTISMHFLPDVTITCNQCKGLRYNYQTLEILYRGKSIAQVLDMTAREAFEFFANHASIEKKLRVMCEVGLDYLKLGQSSTTLSGGEAQRVKLAHELAKRGQKTLYILDEPTTGLHSQDIKKLLIVLNRLIDKGNSIIIIEHNIDVLKTMDYLIDLGPEGGEDGGFIIAQGTPEEVGTHAQSATGYYLRRNI